MLVSPKRPRLVGVAGCAMLPPLLSVLICAGSVAAQAPPSAPAAPPPPAAAPAPAPSPTGSQAADVAQQLANPIANLVSIPFQFNWEQGAGPNEDLRFVLNVQPVVPFSLNDKWNLVGRMIVPFIGQPALVPGGQPTSGTGDILLSTFISPVESKRAIWGIGPVFGLPTTTDPFLGSGKWLIGPTAVVLKQVGQFTYGALVNHLWSVANTGNYERADVNQTYLQPFFNYATKDGVSMGVSSEASANWTADVDTWTVPLVVSISKVTRLGPFPFSLGGGVGFMAAKPDGAPDWKLRFTGTVILPRTR